MLDVRRLRVLREVALRGSIAAAAESLRFTPSAVSQQAGEARAGGRRPAGRARPEERRLTPAGWRLVEHAESILERLAAAEAGAARARRVASPSFASARTRRRPSASCPTRSARFAAARPEIEVTVTESDPLVSLARLRARELDLAIVFEYDHVPLPSDPRARARAPARGADAHRASRRAPRRAPARGAAARPRRRDLDQEHDRARPATRSPSAPAGRPASSRASASSSTTTRRCRTSSPRASGVAFAPDLGLSRLNPAWPCVRSPSGRSVGSTPRTAPASGGGHGIPEMLDALRGRIRGPRAAVPGASPAPRSRDGWPSLFRRGVRNLTRMRQGRLALGVAVLVVLLAAGCSGSSEQAGRRHLVLRRESTTDRPPRATPVETQPAPRSPTPGPAAGGRSRSRPSPRGSTRRCSPPRRPASRTVSTSSSRPGGSAVRRGPATCSTSRSSTSARRDLHRRRAGAPLDGVPSRLRLERPLLRQLHRPRG